MDLVFYRALESPGFPDSPWYRLPAPAQICKTKSAFGSDPPRVPGPQQLFEGCTSGADAEVYDSPPCLEQTTSSNFSAPSGSAILCNIAEKGEASSLPPRNMNSVESIAHLCDDQFVPGMQCASGIWYPAGSLTPRWVIHSPARLMVTQATS